MLLFTACLAAVTVPRAQEAGPVADKATEATESTEGTGAKKAEDAPAATGTDTTPNDATKPAADPTRKPGTVGPTPGRFEPTEKVRADFDVSFPVDI